MSFFGFEPTRHNPAAPGFSQTRDPFAGLSQRADDQEALDFEETYDGLGDQLDEIGDVFNDDTFGTDSGAVSKDFDFFGVTAKVADAIDEGNALFHRQQPTLKTAKATAPEPGPSTSYSYDPYAAAAQTAQPVRSGYEKYKEPDQVPELSIDRSIWGMAPPQSAYQPATSPPAPVIQPARKVLSLEEVEAEMLAQSKRMPTLVPQPGHPTSALLQPLAAAQTTDRYALQAHAQGPAQNTAYYHGQQQPYPGFGHNGPIKILERPHSRQTQATHASPQPPQAPQAQQAQQAQYLSQGQQIRPTQILQNPNRAAGPGHASHRSKGSTGRVPQAPHLSYQGHPGQPHGGPPPLHMDDQEMAVYMEQEAKRAKRNHKIFQLSKDNGIMTPQDKNFVTRIQLQQLVAATGSPMDAGRDAAESEDFYYQVYTSIRSTQRQNPNQPLGNFAQTYLFQTGNRQGGRRHGRPAENHVQRMEQQVQRAVEAAKNKPKNPQLVIAGSLGKISFSNAKTPKPLLNIKRPEVLADAQRPSSSRRHAGPVDGKAILRSIENVYTTLMKMEDHIRMLPPSPASGIPDDEFHVKHAEWLATTERLNGQLWENLKIHEPVDATPVHPFIALISLAKGKKAIPRVFRHTSAEQKTTILTMIIYHLDQLDVTRGAHIINGEMQADAAMRETVELFSSTVMPSLFAHINETPLAIVDGTLGLIARLNVDLIAKSRIGTSMLTMILSRAELIKQLGEAEAEMWRKWEESFGEFFNILEPSLPHIFPGSVNSGEDVYVWQFLAAIGVSSTPDQQQRLVLAVKDRVLDTVAHAKSLPPSMSGQRLANVNLFMHSIGLDVELLQ